MKNVIYSILVLLCFSMQAIGQTEMIIEPGDIGVINAAIEGDTMATGERNDSNRVYILRRGFPYILSSTMEYRDFHLQLKAEEGEGERPFIIMDSDGDALSQMFRLRGEASLTLDGLHISARDLLGGFNDRVVRINADNSVITINDCLLEDAGQAGIRVQGDNSRIYVTNTTARNMGRPFNPDNGRFIDNRGNPIDTLWVENSVIYNVSSRVYRDGGSASIDWARFNQNTIWGTGQHGISLGDIQSLEFTNNVFFNGVFLGRTQASQDTLEDARFWIMVDTFDASIHNYSVSNNNFHTDQEIIDTFPLVNTDGDTLISVENFVLDLELQAAVEAAGTGATNISEDLGFTKAPIQPFQFIVAAATDTSSSGIPTAEFWDFSDLASDENLSALGTGSETRYREVHDFTYDASAASATAGTDGQALGAQPQASTNTFEFFVDNRIFYYPNPVTDRLYVQNLDKEKLQRIDIYNLVGQRVTSFGNIQNAVYEINTSTLESGTYVLSVIDQSGKISSQKFIKQ